MGGQSGEGQKSKFYIIMGIHRNIVMNKEIDRSQTEQFRRRNIA
jgi:hypothetical protein